MKIQISPPLIVEDVKLLETFGNAENLSELRRFSVAKLSSLTYYPITDKHFELKWVQKFEIRCRDDFSAQREEEHHIGLFVSVPTFSEVLQAFSVISVSACSSYDNMNNN